MASLFHAELGPNSLLTLSPYKAFHDVVPPTSLTLILAIPPLSPSALATWTFMLLVDHRRLTL